MGRAKTPLIYTCEECEARNTLLDLANALGGGQTVYHLQDYLADGSMTWKRDARVKRRGGS